jgi:thymidylate kinase
MSKIVVIEGPDRVGKATQSLFLKRRLEAAGYTATIIEVPIKTNFAYHVVYWMLRNGLAKSLPKIFQWFQYYNRKVFQERDLPRLESTFDYIIMDRWSLSTTIYGEAAGVSKNFTKKLSDRLRRPFYTFVLLGDSHKHVVEDVYEADGYLQRRVRELYEKWANQHPSVCSIIDCNRSREIISNEIWHVLRAVEVQVGGASMVIEEAN